MRVIVEAERRCQRTVLGLRGRRPGSVQVELMRVHPQQAGKEIQARRRIPLKLVENSAVGVEGSNDLRVRIGERMLRIRPRRANGVSGEAAIVETERKKLNGEYSGI